MATLDFPKKNEKSHGFTQDGGNGRVMLATDQENALEMVLEEMKKFNQKFDKLSADVSAVDIKMDDMKTQITNDVLNVQKEIGQLKKSGEMNERALSTLFGKVSAMEEETKERMGNIRVDKNRLGEAEDKLRETQERLRVVQEKMEDQEKKEAEEKRVALYKMLEKKYAENRMLEMGVSQEMTRAKIDDSATLESSKNVTEDEINKKTETENPQMTPFSLANKYGQFKPSFVWTIGEIKNKISQEAFSMTSEIFKWTGYPISTRAKLELTDDDYVYISLEIENVEEVKDLKVIPQVFYVVKGQGSSTVSCCRSIFYLFTNKSRPSIRFKKLLAHKSHFATWPYDVDDAVVFEIYVPSPLMVKQVHSYEGTLEWTIEDYSKKLQAEKKGLIMFDESPCFYTGPKGFRVQAYTKISCSVGPTFGVTFLTGEFDAELPLTFPHKTTITLVNQKNPDKSITKSMKADVKEKREYGMTLGSYEEVEKCLENDTLLCRVTVKAVD